MVNKMNLYIRGLKTSSFGSTNSPFLEPSRVPSRDRTRMRSGRSVLPQANTPPFGSTTLTIPSNHPEQSRGIKAGNASRGLLLVLGLFSLTSIGCGYTTGSLLPSRLKTIYVDNFKNRIEIDKEVTESARYTLYRPGLENDVTNAIVNRFVFDGNLKIANKDSADLILYGELIDYRQEALAYDGDDNVEEYRIKVVVNMKLVDASNDEPMWEEIGFVGEETYRTIGQYVKSEDTARDEAIEDLARRVVERTIEGW